MQIGFNFKKWYGMLYDTVIGVYNTCTQNENNLAMRIETLEEKTSVSDNWIEITASNGQEAEITQNFTEIRMLARCSGGINYTVTVAYDENIFNLSGPSYFICGNPTANNYGCKFKYMIANNKQYVCVDSCFNGGSYDAFEFRAWIKPKVETVPTGPQ